MKKNYLWQVLIAIDQTVNALLGGWADETLSSRAYRQAVKGSTMWSYTESFINLLFFFDTEGDKKHCELAYISEQERMHLPVELRPA